MCLEVLPEVLLAFRRSLPVEKGCSYFKLKSASLYLSTQSASNKTLLVKIMPTMLIIEDIYIHTAKENAA